MSDATSAARMRRLRARKKAASDSVRAFLTGVVDDLRTRMADAKAKVDPWEHSRAATATALLEDLEVGDRREEDAGVRAQLNAICLAHGAVTAEDVEDLLAHHETQYQKWVADPRNTGPAATRPVRSAKVEQAEASLAWADAERLAGRASSPILAQGLRSATVLIRARGRKEARSAFARYTGWVYSRSMAALTQGGHPPYGALSE